MQNREIFYYVGLSTGAPLGPLGPRAAASAPLPPLSGKKEKRKKFRPVFVVESK